MNVDLSRLPETIVAPRTDPIYNCHTYLTKVPIAAIEPFIETFTRIGETVVDFFAGSGMTGLAAAKAGLRLCRVSKPYHRCITRLRFHGPAFWLEHLLQ